MKKYLIRNWYLSILVFAFIFTPRAQEQPVQQTEPKQEELITYKVSEIPSKLEDAQTYLSKLKVDVISPDELVESEKELETVNNSYLILKKQTDSLSLENEYSTTLTEFQQKWVAQKKKVNDWTGIVTSRTEELEEAKKDLLKNKEIWDRTYKFAREEKAPRELTNSIRDLINTINLHGEGISKRN